MSWKHAQPRGQSIGAATDAHVAALRVLGGLPRLPSKQGMLAMYEKMVTIRSFEQRAWESARDGESLPIHPSTGHEAVAVGVCSSLRVRDMVVSNHRPFGHFIAKGGSLRALMAELYGKSTGVCKGMGGEMILSDPSIGFIISSMIVGACLTISVGVGLSLKRKSPGAIAVCFFGDAASTNGAFHEALMMASLYKLPILFVCENNGYSTNTPAIEYMPSETVSPRSSSYGLPSTVVDGTDVLAINDVMQKALQHVRQGSGPYFLETLVSRIGPHKQILVDTRPRDRAQLARMRDPISRFKASLRSEGILNPDTEREIQSRVRARIRDAVSFARRSRPLAGDAMKRLADPASSQD